MLVSILLSLSSNSNAFNIVETYCNDQARQGEWTIGIKDKKSIKAISSQFDPEHRQVLDYLDKLPVKVSEESLLAGIPVKPKSVIRVVKQHGRFQWEIPGNKEKLNVIVMHYKGCVSDISLMSSKNMNFYNRSNILSIHP